MVSRAGSVFDSMERLFEIAEVIGRLLASDAGTDGILRVYQAIEPSELLHNRGQIVHYLQEIIQSTHSSAQVKKAADALGRTADELCQAVLVQNKLVEAQAELSLQSPVSFQAFMNLMKNLAQKAENPSEKQWIEARARTAISPSVDDASHQNQLNVVNELLIRSDQRSDLLLEALEHNYECFHKVSLEVLTSPSFEQARHNPPLLGSLFDALLAQAEWKTVSQLLVFLGLGHYVASAGVTPSPADTAMTGAARVGA